MNEVADDLRNYDISQKNFIQNASHELKTPLMSIQGYAEGIKDEVFQDKEKALDVIIEESQRLRTLVEEIIYLSKIESSGQPIRLEKKRLNEVIDRSVEKISGIMVGNTIKIEKRYFSDNWLLIDEDKMTRAFINILGNCLRYSESVITIEVSDSPESCKIKIKDDGPGFDINEEDKIFERFYKGKKGNTGLGLAITKAIIEKHSGRIIAYNCDSKGACFEITLPL
jgi:signal transduction histidine kinase